MTWSRRKLLTLLPIAGLGCARLPRASASAPAEWLDICFGRHAVKVPQAFAASQEVALQLGALQGSESSDPAAHEALSARWDEDTAAMLPAHASLGTLAFLKVIEHRGILIKLAVLDHGPEYVTEIYINMTMRGGARPLVIQGPLTASSIEGAIKEARALVDSLEPLPTSKHGTPFCSLSYSLDISPRLAQKIDVGMSTVDGRDLILESAYVRGREWFDLGAPVLARHSLAYARSDRAGTGVGNVHVRRRSVKVAGIRAPEVVWTTDEGRGGLLHFAWIHLGVAHDAWRPFLSVYFSGDLAKTSRRELNQQWKQILGSLRPLSKGVVKLEAAQDEWRRAISGLYLVSEYGAR